MTVVVFGAEKGGVGKTSLALNFALLAVAQRVDVVLLDTDRQQTASNWIALRGTCQELPPLSVHVESGDPLRCISRLSRRHDLVVVDIGAQSYQALVECSLVADAFVVPTSTSALDLDTTEDLVAMLGSLALEKRLKTAPCVRAALCKVPTHPNSREVLRTRRRLQQAGVRALDSTLPYRSAWRSMANTGCALHELVGGHQDVRATAEMRGLYDELRRQLAH